MKCNKNMSKNHYTNPIYHTNFKWITRQLNGKPKSNEYSIIEHEILSIGKKTPIQW